MKSQGNVWRIKCRTTFPKFRVQVLTDLFFCVSDRDSTIAFHYFYLLSSQLRIEKLFQIIRIVKYKVHIYTCNFLILNDFSRIFREMRRPCKSSKYVFKIVFVIALSY